MRLAYRFLALAGFALAALLTGAAPALADVKVPSIFSDHMVIQRDALVPVWGWADAGEDVSVSVAGQTRYTQAGVDGRWSVRLHPTKAAKGLTLTVKGRNTLTINDVLCGEVWLGSGQSNMAWRVAQSRDYDKEQTAAVLPEIRMFTVATKAAREPQTACQGSWQVCSPATVGSFSATLYFFGRDLYQKLGVPVGLINSSVGGTPIESWTSMEAMKAEPALAPLLTTWDQRAAAYNPTQAQANYDQQMAAYRTAAETARTEGRPVPRAPQRPTDPRDSPVAPAVLYNGMIAPLIPYAIKGAIWYQGESNAGSEQSGALYGIQLPMMVRDWRARWGEGNFPFGWVQLPGFTTTAQGWPAVREAMVKSLDLPRTGMSINIDIGESNDIHPKNKQDIGRRLALWARAKVYGEQVAWSGPRFATFRPNGSTAEVRFDYAYAGLVAKGGDLKGFEVAGPDGQWKSATGRIDGDRVIVSSTEVAQPVAVRYAWAADPACNLFNGAGLPASPFRTEVRQ